MEGAHGSYMISPIFLLYDETPEGNIDIASVLREISTLNLLSGAPTPEL